MGNGCSFRKTAIALVLLALACQSVSLSAMESADANADSSAKMAWFADAKLGIFIHWGIYSLGKTSESWAFHNKQISHAGYMAQKEQFTAARYRPEEWVKLIRHSGARYAVITSKHHDGVALWDTRMNGLSTAKATPAGKDVLTPFVRELRKAGLKVGLYYSLLDWSHPDYPGFLSDSSRYAIADDPQRWAAFLSFCNGQIGELLGLYNPDLLWFDGDWEHSAEEWQAARIRAMILKADPNAIINGRLAGFGDYDTPEQNFPVSRPKSDYWELCMTTNDSWGYFAEDTHYKTPYEIITIFADAISFGGNLLLDIGPRADGVIPQEQVRILTELGDWTGKHGEAIFGTIAGLPQGHFYGPTTLAKDSTVLYLFLPGRQNGGGVLKGLRSGIRKISIVGNGRELGHKIVGKISWSPVPGLVYIDVPAGAQDRYMTVLKVELDGALRLYRGKGGLAL
jgi:alpha-L-fucosidase